MKTERRLQIVGLAFASILSGGVSLITQALFIRETLILLYGSELSIALVFFVWFVGIFCGAVLIHCTSSIIAKRALSTYVYTSLLSVVLLFVQIYLARISRGFIDVNPGVFISPWTMLLICFLVILPISLCRGCLFPTLCTLLSDSGLFKTPIGATYVFEGIGSLLGGICYTFILIGRFNNFQCIHVLGLTTLLTLLLILWTIRKQSVRMLLIVVFVTLIAWCVGMYQGVFSRLDRHSIQQRFSSLGWQGELLENIDTPYQNLSLSLAQDQYNLAGNGKWLFSFPDHYTSTTTAHLICTQHPQPRAVAVIGTVEPHLLKTMLLHGIHHIDYVELDPFVHTITAPYITKEAHDILGDPRIQRHITDGRYFTNTAPANHYSIISTHVSGPTTALLNRYYTYEFFLQAKQCLSENGILVLSIPSAANFVGPHLRRYAATIYRTLQSLFPEVLVLGEETCYFFAAKREGILTSNAEILINRFDQRNLASPYFHPMIFNQLLPARRINYVNRTLQAMPETRINTDKHPLTYFYNVMLWLQQHTPKLAAVMEYISDNAILTCGILLIVILGIGTCAAAGSALSSAGKRKTFLCFTIYSTGMCSLGIELSILYAYQTQFGSLYSMTGLIAALFMTGIATGGFLSHTLTRKQSYHVWWKSLLATELGFIAFIGILTGLLCLELGHSPLYLVLFYGSVLICGHLTGMEFPLASSLVTRDTGSVIASSSLLEGFDHVGAAGGALLYGCFLLPILGIIQSCIFFFFFKLVAVLFLCRIRHQFKKVYV